MIKTLLTLALSSLLFTAGIAHAKLYRWVDENGNTHYTDKIPPRYSQDAHSEISGEGVKLRDIHAAKNKQEIMREKALKRLRAERQKLIDIQEAKDKVLLKTFRSIDDIVLARNGKIASIDVSIKVLNGNIKRMKNKLAEMQDNAANLEKQGQPVNKNYLKQIHQVRNDIRAAYSSIVKKEKQKQIIAERFNADIRRFEQLKQLSPEQMAASNAHAKTKIDNIIHCPTKATCDQRWEKAEKFVRKYATTPIQILGANIVVTKQPVKGHQLSVSMSRIPDNKSDGATLFIDIQCTSTLTGRELCEGSKFTEIMLQFRDIFGPDEHQKKNLKTQ